LNDEQVCKIVDIYSQRLDAAQHAAAFIGAGRPIDDLAKLRLSLRLEKNAALEESAKDGTQDAANILLITVPDDAIEPCAVQITRSCTDLVGFTAIHCSGSLTSNALRPLADLGAAIASVHPIKSFSDPATSTATFAGTDCAVEAEDENTRRLATDIFSAIGASTFDLDARTKTLYHAGTVMVCNYLYALLHVGLETLDKVGIPEPLAKHAIESIATETLSNGLRLGPAQALTGPIRRGDLGTVNQHIAALAQHLPHFSTAYAALGQVTARMARDTGNLDEKQCEEILSALTIDNR
jgi:predicted short-subunit dehydrogenase-like oxidoreductase (DUF2520 family)